ncbi:DUF72 domain-containing protein [Piscinibacter sp. XHJ-5]|uniref:DUF72 domain-containing protein n=1 Tax=Piscinibacter sp. XHJ-5 TaxID=3037797 RepID=UPI0024537050|nr:DUF72 domain-containing protein [Piscinibacter sp. XHJ-5]
MRIGTAGWSISREAAGSLPGEGQHLQRYARVLNCAEINSSFHRSHRLQVYQRWAAQTPPGFRFSAKLPRSITHQARLRRARKPLQDFLAEVAGLGDRLAVLLVQLPPGFAFEARPVRGFFSLLAELFAGSVVCEPRHESWFLPSAERALAALKVSRAAVDPARWPQAARPGGWLGPRGDGNGALLYHRWHGSPRMYWSRYERPWVSERASELRAWPADADCWCIFDNTAGGGATSNALELQQMLQR